MSDLVIEQPEEIVSVIELPKQIFSVIEPRLDLALVLLNSSSLNSTIEAQLSLRSSILVGQGPAGVGAGDAVKYSKKIDAVGDDVIYEGEALPGSLTTDPVWRICRTTFTGDDIDKVWANGAADFANMWSSRLTLTYS